MSQPISLVEHALEIARLGLPVFPLWWPRNGGCACRAGNECRQPGKHPRILGWQREATIDETKIREWWAHWPVANIGIATGSVENRLGILVLDVDAASDGIEALAALEAAHGALPETVEVLTGRANLDGVRGRHLYFSHPGIPLGNSVKKLGPGLDLRCDGGLVVGPGSIHASGLTYEWEIAHHPENTPFAEAPRWVLDLVLNSTRQAPDSVTTVWSEPDGLPPLEVRLERAKAWLANREPAVQGQNGSGHTMGICSVVTRGFALEHDEDALEALAEWNARCMPPWDERPEAKSADSLLRKIREGRSKSYVCSIAEKLLPPRRIYFGSQLARSPQTECAGDSNVEDGVEAGEDPPEDRVLAFTGDRGELPLLIQATEQALRGQELYAYGSTLVTVSHEAGGPILALTDKDHLRVLVNGVIGFVKPHGKEFRSCWPPDELLGGILSKRKWNLPTISSVVETPTLRPDGTVVDQPGFDARSGIMFASMSQKWEPVPDEPTSDNLVEALLWLQEPFVDFPFQSPHHQAAAIAALVTAIVRPAIEGPVPMFLFDANTPGTGKGLLANVVSMVATGRRAPVIPPIHDEEELRKLITSLAMEGSRLVIFDNVAKPLGGPTLEASVTSTWWQGRILGSNKTFHGPLKPFWGATGNNLQVKGDMSRRVVPIRMTATVEDPESREDFTHPNLLSWVRDSRAEIVAAALKLVRAYVAAGCPRPAGLSPLGGFEEWDHMVRAPLAWQGLPDILAGRQELKNQSDGETAIIRRLLREWQRHFGNHPLTLRALKRRVDTAEDMSEMKDILVDLAGTNDGKDWQVARAGYLLRRYQGRIFDGLRLVADSKSESGIRWLVEGV